MAQEIEYEIEHHFEHKHLSPRYEQVCPGVRIVKTSESGEFFIEDGFGEYSGKVIINCGGLSIKLDQFAFKNALEEYKKEK